jgi:hypothetical protein
VLRAEPQRLMELVQGHFRDTAGLFDGARPDLVVFATFPYRRRRRIRGNTLGTAEPVRGPPSGRVPMGTRRCVAESTWSAALQPCAPPPDWSRAGRGLRPWAARGSLGVGSLRAVGVVIPDQQVVPGLLRASEWSLDDAVAVRTPATERGQQASASRRGCAWLRFHGPGGESRLPLRRPRPRSAANGAFPARRRPQSPGGIGPTLNDGITARRRSFDSGLG